jgi:hypothetical protein
LVTELPRRFLALATQPFVGHSAITLYDVWMANILVYEYEQFDARSRHWTRAPQLGTADAIRAMGGRIVVGSGRQVFEESVSDKGFVRQAASIAKR